MRNIILSFQDKEEEFRANKQNIQKFVQNASNTLWRGIEHYADYLKYFPIFKTLYEKVVNDAEALAQFYLRQIDEHKKRINFEMDDEPTDYVEAFLKYRHKLEKSGQKEHTFT